MRILSLFIFLISILFFYPSYAYKTDDSDIDSKLCNMLQNAYIKEQNIIHQLTKLTNNYIPYSTITTILDVHKANMQTLNNIMLEYTLSIPIVTTENTAPIKDLKTCCTEIINLQEELIVFYNNNLRLLSTFQKNESIGSIIEVFEKLKNNIDYTDYSIMCSNF